MITITAAASKHFSNILRASGNNAIRLSITKSGCSGFAYKLTMEDSYLDWDPTDIRETSEGIDVVCSQKDLPLLDGMTVDFMSNGMESRIVFINPNETACCGCGKSVEFK